MAIISEFDEDEASLLRFVLDTTIEQWLAQQSGQLMLCADDPTTKTFEDMLSTTATLTSLPVMLQGIRKKLSPR